MFSLKYFAFGILATLIYTVGLTNATIEELTKTFDNSNYACDTKPAVVYITYSSTQSATRFGYYGTFDGSVKYDYHDYNNSTEANAVGLYVYDLASTATVYTFVREETGSPTWTDQDEQDYIAGKKDLASGVTYTFFYGSGGKSEYYVALTTASPKSFSIDPCDGHEGESPAIVYPTYFTIKGTA